MDVYSGVGIYSRARINSGVGLHSKYWCTVDIIPRFSAELLSKDLYVSVPSIICTGKSYISLAESNGKGEY